MISGPPPGRILFISLLLRLVAAVLGVAIARRRIEHRPVASFLAATTLADLVLMGFILAGAPTAVPAAPFTGVDRVLFHVRQSLYLVWPFGLAAANIAVFGRRRPWPVVPTYGIALAVLAVGYPTLRGESLRQAYLAIEIGAVLVSFGVLIPWIGRRAWPSLTHTTAILLLAGETAVLFGVWKGDIFGGWDIGRVMYTVIYAVIVVIQGGALWKEPSSSS